MAQFTITTTPKEQKAVLAVLSTMKDKTVSLSQVAKEAKLNTNRVRYIVTDLEEAGKIKRVPTKAFNAHYIRYKYEVINHE